MNDRPKILQPDAKSVIVPKAGDSDIAQDILDELVGIMRKRGCCLIAEDGYFALCRIEEKDTPRQINRCIAKVRLVNHLYHESAMVRPR